MGTSTVGYVSRGTSYELDFRKWRVCQIARLARAHRTLSVRVSRDPNTTSVLNMDILDECAGARVGNMKSVYESKFDSL
jgi:hypothetical protein